MKARVRPSAVGFLLLGLLTSLVAGRPAATQGPPPAPRYTISTVPVDGARGDTLLDFNDQGEVLAHVNGTVTFIRNGQAVGLDNPPPVGDDRTTIRPGYGFLSSNGLVIADVAYSEPGFPNAFNFYPHLWQDGVWTPLTELKGAGSTVGINAEGTAVGRLAGDFVWLRRNGVLETLEPGVPLAIGPTGLVAGWMQVVQDFETYTRPCIWRNGVRTMLPSLAPADSGRSLAYDTPKAINASEQIVGVGYERPGGEFRNHAVMWENGAVRKLAPDAGFSDAFDINDSGVIIGMVNEVLGVWHGGRFHPIQSLLPANSGWMISQLIAVNKSGQILASGWRGVVGSGLILTPGAPEPVTPVLTNARVSPAVLPAAGGTVTLRVDVADNVGVFAVDGKVTGPDGVEVTVSVDREAGNTYAGVFQVPANTGAASQGYSARFTARTVSGSLVEPVGPVLFTVAAVGATLPATITGVTPASGSAGQTLSVRIQGTRFRPGATVSFGDGIAVKSAVVSKTGVGKRPVSALADHLLTCSITIAASAAPGARTVTVTNPGGEAPVAKAGAFTVVAAPSGPTIQGKVTGSGGALAGVLVKAGTASATTGESGEYTLSGLTAGKTYTVTPTLAGYVFTPATASVKKLKATGATGVNFQGARMFRISGRVTTTTGGLAKVVVTATRTPKGSGKSTFTATTNSSGEYTILNVPEGSYTLKPALKKTSFTPTSQSVTVAGEDEPGIDFQKK